MVRFLFYILLVVAPIAAQAQKLRTYENKEIRLQYPDGWKADSTKMKVTVNVRLYIPTTKAGELSTEIVISKEPAAGRALEEVTETWIDGNAEPLGIMVNVIVDGIEGYRTISHLNKMYVSNVYFMHNSQLYIITCFTTAENYAAYEKDFEVILGSIKFK